MALLELRDVRKTFSLSGGRQVRAVDGVTLSVEPRTTLGLVGESGCGKSTLARCILGLHPINSGSITFAGRDLTGLGRGALRDVRRDLVMVFQDPFASLNPRRRVRDIVAAPLDIHGMARGAERRRRVGEMLERVGLEPNHGARFPHEFSGGQRQRIGLARALITRPKLVVCDEPVSALDVSIQAQILNLLTSLQRELDLTLVFIAHDLGVVRHISQQIAVMYLGEVVEIGAADELFAHPRHPYTEALLAAVPVPDPGARRAHDEVISGEAPSAAAPPTGCRFHPRCQYADERCRVTRPELGVAEVACHYPLKPAGD
jgi:oligopeptide/dipeptide ABC transporter ATP-binding protein